MTSPAETTPSPGGSERLVTLPFLLVTASTFAYFTALGIMLPTLPRYVEDELGGGGTAVGVVVGAFAVSAALLRPWVGRLGDRHGRKILVVGGSAVVAVSVAGYALTTNLVVLVALRLLTGVGEAAMWVGAATAVQDMAPPDRRGEAASYFSVALYAGIAMGPALGEVVLQARGFDEVWLVAAGCAALATVFGLWTPVGTRSEPTRGPLLHRAALGPGFVLFLGLLPFVGFSSFIALYGDEIGLDDIGPVFFAYAGLVLVIRVVGARLPDRLGWHRASTAALTALVTGGLVLGLWHAAAGVWVATVALAIGMSLLFPALFSLAVTRAPEEERSQAVGTFSVFFDLASGVGAPLLGLVVSLSSEQGAFLVSGLVAAIGFYAISRLRTGAGADEGVAAHVPLPPDEPAAG